MYKDHEQLNCVEDNISLWKYMDLLKFVNILTSNSIWFNRIDSFEDVYEGVFPSANKDKRAEIYNGNAPPQFVYENLQKYARDRLYVLCLHNNDYESAAMWSLYAKDNGIAIKTNSKRLKDCFSAEEKEIYISHVSYIDYDRDFMPEGNTFYLGTHKRTSFEHEKEIRCMYLDQGETPRNKGVYIKIDVTTFIEEIYISPYAPAYMKKTVEDLLKKFSLDISVIQSPLYSLNK